MSDEEKKDIGYECSCQKKIDPYDKLCPQCKRIVREDALDKLAELDEECGL
jgi:predicted amidophosphoribosyltransferase